MDENKVEKSGSFHSYIIKVMDADDLSRANGKNRWVITCDRDYLEDTENAFDEFMEDITTYMGDDTLGELIGVKIGNTWELPSREIL